MRTILLMTLVLLACSDPTGVTYGYKEGAWAGKDARNFPVNGIMERAGSHGWAMNQLTFYVVADSTFASSLTVQHPLLIFNASFEFDTLSTAGRSVHIEAYYDGETWQGVHVTELAAGPDSVTFYMEWRD